jgi:hypothetical protein
MLVMERSTTKEITTFCTVYWKKILVWNKWKKKLFFICIHVLNLQL